MVEEDVANYIAMNTSLVTGTDLFLNQLPANTPEGAAVRVIRSPKPWGNLTTTLISIFIFYNSFVTNRNLVDSLVILFNDYRGSLGSWSISGQVSWSNYGKDDYDRYVTSVNIEISH